MAREVYAPKDASTQQRQRVGRAISPDRIELALRAAYVGIMRDVTDLLRETIDTDPHLAAVLAKRLLAVASLEWDVVPASGDGIDVDKAEFYAKVVREQLKGMNGFRRFLGRLAWGLVDGRAAEELIWVEVPNGERGPGGQVTMAVRTSSWIHPRRLHFGPARELRLVGDGYVSGRAFAPVGLDLRDAPYKFVQWLPQLFGDYPEREGLGQRCMYWSFFKRFGARERLILAELFGKPWRIAEVDEASMASAEDLRAAEAALDSLGSTYTARIARGIKVQVIRPDGNDGKIHADIIKESDQQNSKLVLGQTGTTDAQPTGLGSNTTKVMSDEQDGLLLSDARMLSEVVEDELTDAIIVVNFGPDELPHAPSFQLRTQGPVNRATETARLQAALNAGMPVLLSEAYEATGFTQPTDDDEVLQPTGSLPIVGAEDDPTPVDEDGDAPDSGDLAAAGSAGGDVQKQALNGAQVSSLLEIARAVGTGDLSADAAVQIIISSFPISEDDARRIVKNDGSARREPDDPNDPDDEENNPRPIPPELARAQARAERVLATDRGCVHCAGDHDQPDGPNGNVEQVLESYAAEARGLVDEIVDTYARAVEGEDTAAGIRSALRRARTRMNVKPLGRSLERCMVHGAALGALDAHDEDDGAVEAAAKKRKAKVSSMPFEQAMRIFKQREPVPRKTFDRLSAKAKKRAFTVAGVVRNDALAIIQSDLADLIGKGTSLASFSKRIKERMEEAGFRSSLRKLGNGQKALSASHTEVVYRTNTLGAYNAGRAEQMRQPAVLARRPVWEIRSIQDARGREEGGHAHLNGLKLLATDPLWKKAYPPFRWNCRCRVLSRSKAYLDGVVKGSTIKDLPVDGFSGGIGSILSTDVL